MMDNFDLVMERAFNDEMNAKMKAAYDEGRNIDDTKYMKIAKQDLGEARKLVKRGEIKEAKKKYQSCLDNMMASIEVLEHTMLALDNSGNTHANRTKCFAIVASTLAWFAAIIMIAITATNDLNNNRKGAAAIKAGGLVSGAIIHNRAVNRISKYVGKDNRVNYKEFAKQYREDPKIVIQDIIKSINASYNEIHKEMNLNCK